MRTSLYLIGVAAASILSAGAVGFGCSSSSSSAPPPTQDAAMAETGTPEAGEAGEDSGDTGVEDAACVPTPGVNVSTFDAGSIWGCTVAACADAGLDMCGTDCSCNNAVLGALLCIADAGESQAVDCFTTALTPVFADPTVAAVATCLQSQAVTNCTGGGTPDGGDGGTTTDGGDGGTTPDASDAGAGPG